MIIHSKFSGYSRDGIRLYPSGGGGGGPTTSTVNQSNIPDWLRPQVEQLLGGATKQLFKTTEIPGTIDPNTGVAGPSTYDITGTKNFVPYSANPRDYLANFSPLQQQAQANAANLQVPDQFGQGTQLAGAAGQGALDSTGQAYGYGNAGFQSGQQGQDIGTQGGGYYGDMGAGYGQQAAGIGQMGLRAEQTGRQIGDQAQQYAAQAASAGQNYANQATDPNAIQAYMSPYMQNVVNIQNDVAQRNADIASTQRGASAARSGAFGGARQAIENAEANKALQATMNSNQVSGMQQAYQQAQQAQQYGAGLGLQGLQGAQQGLGTALQGGQLGLSGIGTALQGMQGGMQGAGVGLQGVNAQLAGTAQGMQGAGVGLQGVQGAQAGYGVANQSAATLGSLGTQQNQAQMSILGLQNQMGAEQTAREQAILNQNISSYAQAQNAPMEAMNQYNSLLRGYAVPGTTTTQYQAAPSGASTLVGLGTAAVGASKLMAKGGKVKAPRRPAGLAELALSRMA